MAGTRRGPGGARSLVAAGGRALLGAGMLLCPLRPRSASGSRGVTAARVPAPLDSPAGAPLPPTLPPPPTPAAARGGPSPPASSAAAASPRLRLSPRRPPPAAPGRSARSRPGPAPPTRPGARPHLGLGAGVVGAPREHGNWWRRREKVLIQTAARGATFTRFPPPSPPSRQSRPVRPWGPPMRAQGAGAWPE